MNNNTANEQKDFGQEFNPVPLLKFLLHKLWLIVVVAVLFAALAYGATKLFVNPTYRSGFTAYVNNQHSQTIKDSLTNSDIQAAHELVETYSTILKSNSVLTAAGAEAGFDYTYGQLQKMVSTQIMDNTEIIAVYVVMQNAEDAYRLASTISQVAPAYIKEIVEGSSMKVIDQPEIPIFRHGPSYVKAGIISAVIGIALTLLILIIRFFGKDTILDESGLEERFGFPVLGVIPDTNEVKKMNSDYSYYKKNPGKDSKEEK